MLKYSKTKPIAVARAIIAADLKKSVMIVFGDAFRGELSVFVAFKGIFKSVHLIIIIPYCRMYFQYPSVILKAL